MSEDAHTIQAQDDGSLVAANYSPAKEGRLIMKAANGLEWMRFEPSGDVYVRGNKVDSDRKVYECFREWLNQAMPGKL